MARRSTGVRLPSGQGGLTAGYDTTFHSKLQFNPHLIVVFSLVIVVFIWILFATA